MAKKLSVADILAAARAEKGGSATSPPAEASPAAPAPAPAEEAEPAAEAAPAPATEAKPAAKKPAGAMSMADILAAARAGKAGGAAAAPAAKEAPSPPRQSRLPLAKAAAAAKPAAEAKPAAAAVAAKDTASILAAARKGAKPGPMTKAEAPPKASRSPREEEARSSANAGQAGLCPAASSRCRDSDTPLASWPVWSASPSARRWRLGSRRWPSRI